MKYSDAFEILCSMSFDTDMDVTTKRDRVAFFLERITIVEHRQLGSLANDEKHKKRKEEALQNVVKMTDTEWKMVSKIMEEHANETIATDWWKAMRMDWVRALDTLRAFS